MSATVDTDGGRSELLSRLSLLVHNIAEGYIVVELTSLIETHEPLPSPSFLSGYPDKMVTWVTEL